VAQRERIARGGVLADCIGRYYARKSLRFEIKPVSGTENFIYDTVFPSEDLAEGLNTVKDIITTQHKAVVRRVFNLLPDPLPEDPRVIVNAFRRDPDFAAVNDSNAYNMLKSLLERCKKNRLTIPPVVKNILGWSALYMKWHWHCIVQRKISALEGLPVEWAGKGKAKVLAECKWLHPQKPHKQSRNKWFDHAPFRLMFDNHSTGKSWYADDFAVSRNFLLKSGERILVGVVPRDSKVNPFTMPRPLPIEEAYELYVENAGETPLFCQIPRALIDAAARMGTLYLFELSGRCLRGSSNLNAMFLRALLSEENFANGIFHLDKTSEFHFRKATSSRDYLRKDEHFRQRFTQDKFFVTLHFTCNAQRLTNPEHVLPLKNAKKYMKKHSLERYVEVSQAKDGYLVKAIRAFADNAFEPITISHKDAMNGKLASFLAKIVLEYDVNVILRKSIPEKIVTLVLRKFEYVVVKGRKPFEDGGILRGYQIKDRVFAGEWKSLSTQETVKKADEKKEIPKAPTGELQRFRYVYMTSDRVRHRAEIMAESKEDAYARLRTMKIRPIRVLAEGEEEPKPKDFARKAKEKAQKEAQSNSPVHNIADRLRQLSALKEEGLLTEAEYAEQRARIISSI
jgi:hypothetical protein